MPLLLADAEYRAYSAWMAERARLYEPVGAWRRIGRLYGLLRMGGYWRFNGRSLLGARALAKDLTLDASVTALGSRVTRASRDAS